MTPLRALLIDLDGVLRLWSLENDRRAEETHGLPPGALRRTAFAPELLRPAILGTVTDREWRHSVAARLRALFPTAAAEAAVRQWSVSVGAVDGAVLALVAACRRRGAAVLVTNATSRLAEDLGRLGLGEAFDAVVNSSAVGCAKPELAIYRAALAAARVEAGEAGFVDDTPANVAAARTAGIPSHLYRGAKALEDQLRDWGLLSREGA